MNLFNNDLNKTAIAMGKAIKLLDDVQGKLSWDNDLYEQKEALYLIAYVCRVGILDRIEKNNWFMSGPISIPSGLFKFKKITIAEGLMQTVFRLKEMVIDDVFLESNVNEILERKQFFHEYLNIFTEEQLKQLNKSI